MNRAEYQLALVEKLPFMIILCHFGRVIPNIHVTLDHFSITLDISCHFGQCYKRPCFLLVKTCLQFQFHSKILKIPIEKESITQNLANRLRGPHSSRLCWWSKLPKLKCKSWPRINKGTGNAGKPPTPIPMNSCTCNLIPFEVLTQYTHKP